jgi:CUG-BP- and ETR3-like factor
MSHLTQTTMFASAAQSDASSFLLGPGPPIVTGDSERGPAGCNLFVFHLPNELTNWDLYLLFRKFGTIISVHTMINKNTGLSRGFGFVSFSVEDEAIAAVRSMDGFRVRKLSND